MTEAVTWRTDGVPMSARFGDIYHTEAGALAQSRHVFLAGCGLPQAWAEAAQWRVLETGFGFGLNFLATWQAWRGDPQRSTLLHFVSIEAHPVSADDLLRAASAYPELADLAELLAAQWHGLLPGFHRLAFDGGRVLLTLSIGDVQAMLRAQHFEADSIFLDGFSPERNPAMWSPETLKAVARFARRGTRIATWTIARAVRDVLAQAGFQVRKEKGLPPKRDCLQGVHDPAWTPRRRVPAAPATVPGHCAVIGAGLAGAAVAASLARRGWRVTVLDAGERPATGASGLPVGVMAPHVSSDDALLSRLTRAGVRATWQQLETLLQSGNDWRPTGVVERRSATDMRVPTDWTPDGPNDSWQASPSQLAETRLPTDAQALWHRRGAWVKPARLIDAWLAQPGIRYQGRSRVARLEPVAGGGWAAIGADGQALVQADRIVIAAGADSPALVSDFPMQPVRGQVSWGRMADAATPSSIPEMPINGDGHLIGHVPDAAGDYWLTGATFDRDSRDLQTHAADLDANRARLVRLHPGAAESLAAAFAQGRVASWTGVRCASADRRPLVGPCDPSAPDGVWLCTAMGSRGLSFVALCAELLAARWHAEPLPLPSRLAAALDASRANGASRVQCEKRRAPPST